MLQKTYSRLRQSHVLAYYDPGLQLFTVLLRRLDEPRSHPAPLAERGADPGLAVTTTRAWRFGSPSFRSSSSSSAATTPPCSSSRARTKLSCRRKIETEWKQPWPTGARDWTWKSLEPSCFPSPGPMRSRPHSRVARAALDGMATPRAVNAHQVAEQSVARRPAGVRCERRRRRRHRRIGVVQCVRGST